MIFLLGEWREKCPDWAAPSTSDAKMHRGITLWTAGGTGAETQASRSQPNATFPLGFPRDSARAPRRDMKARALTLPRTAADHLD